MHPNKNSGAEWEIRTIFKNHVILIQCNGNKGTLSGNSRSVFPLLSHTAAYVSECYC